LQNKYVSLNIKLEVKRDPQLSYIQNVPHDKLFSIIFKLNLDCLFIQFLWSNLAGVSRVKKLIAEFVEVLFYFYFPGKRPETVYGRLQQSDEYKEYKIVFIATAARSVLLPRASNSPSGFETAEFAH
jgi:hypothetical protein